MAINTEIIMPIGMNRDALIGTGNSDKYAFENLNLRYIASEDGTTGSWTVERSTKEERTSEDKSVLPTGANVLGQAVINDTLILFIKNNNYDYIIKVYYVGDTINADTLYRGNLNFSKKIETTTYYENENIQKVYWVDGVNPLRMINISRVKASSNFDTQFDTLPELDLNEIVTIEKSYDGSGMFPSGTTQYFFTYVDKYGRESNIFYASSLYYNSLKDRGLNPDGSEYASCSYRIGITHLNIENKFDYVRIYSVIRPSEGATPIARIVVDLDLNNNDDSREDSIFYIDTNTTGEIIDYTTIMFLGGKPIIPSTLEQKNSTLFLGNLKFGNLYNITSNFKKDIKDNTTIIFEQVDKLNTDAEYTQEDYPFNRALDFSADGITTFKNGVTYRFALQFQDIYGNWTEAIYLGDKKNGQNNDIDYKVQAKATVNFGQLSIDNRILLNSFKKARLLCTYPTITDREVVAQGVLCPTMYHPAWEKVHAPDRFSSWFFRPEKGDTSGITGSLQLHEAEHLDSSVFEGDYSLKLEVNSTIDNWDQLFDSNNNTITDQDLLKVTITNTNLAKYFSVSYTHNSDTFKEHIDGHTSGSYKYVQATISVQLNNSATSQSIYFIRLYEYNPFSIYFRPYNSLNNYYCQITNNTLSNNITATIENYADDGVHFNSTHNSIKVSYSRNNPNITVSYVFTANNEIKSNVSYKCITANMYSISTNPSINDTNHISFYDYTESLGVTVNFNSIIEGFNRNSYYYYDGDVQGGYNWDSKGRILNEVQSDNIITGDYNGNLSLDEHGFYVDTEKYFTLHSPDIEYNESLQTTNIQDCKLRIIGQVNQTAWATDIDVDAKVGVDLLGNKGKGLIKNTANNNYHYTLGTDVYDVNVDSPFYWNDIDVYASNCTSQDSQKRQIDYYTYDYRIYPFHRKYLNNYVRDLTIPISGGQHSSSNDSETTIEPSSEILYKCISTYRVFGINILYPTTSETANSVDTLIWNNNSYKPLRLKSNNNTIKYNGAIDDIAEPYTDSSHFDTSEVHKFDGLFYDTPQTTAGSVIGQETLASDNSQEQTSDIIHIFKGSYPVKTYNKIYKRVGRNDLTYLAADSEGPQIRFKSSTHAVLNLTGISFPTRTLKHPSLYLAELIRTVNNAYGGNSNTAIKNNVFYPCGMPVSIRNNNDQILANVDVFGTRGDCYYMAYDCMKTYPYSNEERNGIVEIASFNCESYINLNGRYDKYIGQMTDITNLDKTKFGLINLGYTQNKDFFSYHVIDDDDSNLNNYPNQITWTKTKTPGEIVDTWTNITLANVANAEGTMGSITSLNIYNDNLLMFQEHGIAQLGYNEKTAISTENGLPLEIASSNKFTGFAYLSKEIGCQNKWSINTSKNGIMFIDNSRKELNIVGESIVSLSTKHGFDHFFINELEADSDFTTYYDKLSKDIYYLNSRCCLAYNEVSGTFTSFYNYEGITALATISNHSIVSKNDSIWALREGNSYSNYFNVTKPYRMIVCCDGGKYFQTDKVFNTVETRSDIFNPDSINSTVDENPFDTIAAWTSYQKPVDFALDGTDPLYEWTAARRYNIWRYIIPRATYNESTITRDRIRNPFAFIKLERKLPSGNRAIIHDMVISYDIR